MTTEHLNVTRLSTHLLPQENRVIIRYFEPNDPNRKLGILERILRLSDEQVSFQLSQAFENYRIRHRQLEEAFYNHYKAVSHCVPRDETALSRERRLLIGAYFTMEYSFESSALSNPSIVAFPDQSDLPKGAVRFLMSLRATGEGHLSSIVFRRGIIESQNGIIFDPQPRYAYCARPIPNHRYHKGWFFQRLIEMDIYQDVCRLVLDRLPEEFHLENLSNAIEKVKQSVQLPPSSLSVFEKMIWLAQANYELHFPSDCMPSEIVIFPSTENELKGMEDLRMVRFVDDDGAVRFYGTYTAFNGSGVLPMLIETKDFSKFSVKTLSGSCARDKGMALFPRKINGKYMMISRHDGENLYLAVSPSVYFWDRARKLLEPQEPWEVVQLGNCGSPVETDAGWILLTHGVGAMRQYSIGAVLLDRNDPARVLGRLRNPILCPSGSEREGYVPNVVYSCGSIICGQWLIIPYGMSDSRTSFAVVSVKELIDRLIDSGP
ncbi:MAG: glycoside hydrolase family 130 protein [Deltaproteobacteria bacterium]|nr:glycoside hydrolase family 130 protein [Deltaproteobacteria bacterium]MBW1995339.1 glycoside hydrolase family 130 protein [Deltaproteobacteria bacterium]MBW2152513.1 glycoside hydrolase family 130 protein [Deltaproteobacteria bacterium]